MNNTIDQQFIEYIVKSLVGNPNAVKIERRIDEKGVLLELSVDPDDLGRVIGKRGATAQSLRTLLRALGTKQDARYNLKIIDPNNNREGGSDYRSNHDEYRNNHGSDSSENATSPAAAPVDDAQDDTAVDVPEDTEHSDRISQARKELADLDDLDV